jgi:hypothetical protein
MASTTANTAKVHGRSRLVDMIHQTAHTKLVLWKKEEWFALPMRYQCMEFMRRNVILVVVFGTLK